MLADPEIDLVDICLPTDLHEKAALESIAAGKPTFIEKPIALDLKAADRVVRAAKKAGVPLLVAHVLPFFPEFRFAYDCVHGGKYGRLLAAHFRRVITPPKWSRHIENFRKLGGWGDRPAHSRQPLHPCLVRQAGEGLFARHRLGRLRELRGLSISLSRSATGGELRQWWHRRVRPAVRPWV